MKLFPADDRRAVSLSARRAWIEMCGGGWGSAPDWRSLSARRAWIEIYPRFHRRTGPAVALRKESVDRNSEIACHPFWGCGSLSARRAWIEISIARKISADCGVALRKESVDRNVYGALAITNLKKSLSARRAWNVSLSDCSGWFCSCGYPL